jgi:glycosyltransferase involved in cell wall biosynthesis
MLSRDSKVQGPNSFERSESDFISKKHDRQTGARSEPTPGKQGRAKLKIARIIARLNTGGPARHVVWATHGLRDDFDTTLICGYVSPGEGDMSYFAAQYGVEPYFIPEMSRELSPKDVVSLWKLYRLLRREKPDIIHTHTAKAGTLGRTAGFIYRWLTPGTLIGKPRRVRFIHTYHGHVFHSYYGSLKTRVFLTIEKILAALATDKIFVLSEQQRGEIHEQFGVGRAGQFQIVPLGVDLQPFAESESRRHVLRDEIGAAGDEILVGIVGRLTEVKNHPLFLRVAQLWQERKQTDFPPLRFIVIGDGHLRETLEEQAKELALENIIFLGERDDPHNFYPGLDIVALTSFNEGTPLSLIEAMANGQAVISTAVGGVIDLLGKPDGSKNGDLSYIMGERGILTRSDDAEGFFQGLTCLVSDVKLRESFARRGKEFVAAKYSVERLLSDFRKLYKSFEF